MTRGFGRGLSLSALNIHSLLLDIEGTTTPIAFVYEVLFPFARACADAGVHGAPRRLNPSWLTSTG